MNIQSWNLVGKKVFVRFDGNVPIENGVIQNDFRLTALLPTLELLKEKGAHITLATHIGRPEGADPAFSTHPLKEWFASRGYGNSSVTVLENLRFNAGEKNQDSAHAQEYARELAKGMDYYVNDAWGLMHRKDTSITIVPTLFAPDKRAFGLLVEKELAALTDLKNNPVKPYVVILGGGKVETKLPVIERLIDSNKPTTIIILPALAATFAKALGNPVGKSLVDDALLGQAQKILEKKACTNNLELLFPLDYTFVENSWDGPLKTCDAQNFPVHGIAMSVGPRSLELFAPYIKNAATLFFNGAMGNPSRPETMKPLNELLRMIAASDAYSVIGGGNSVTEVENLGLMKKIDYCSTGGGSTLLYISDAELPGLEVMTDA